MSNLRKLRGLFVAVSALALAAEPAEAAYSPQYAYKNRAQTFTLTQTFTLAPVFTDPAGTRTALGITTGTSGHALCYMDTACIWSALQTISAASGSGGLELLNTTRSRNWLIRPINDQESGTAVSLQFYSTLEPGNFPSGGTGPDQIAYLSGNNGRLVVGHNDVQGVLGGRVYTVIQAVGTNPGENNNFIGDAFDGWVQFDGRRFDTSTGNGLGTRIPVGADKVLVAFCGTAFDGTSDNCGGGLQIVTTEAQVHGSNEGQAFHLFHTLNGSTGLIPAIVGSACGLGGISIGWVGSGSTLCTAVPTDLGQGSLNVYRDVATGRHFRGLGSKPSSSDCTISFADGTTDMGGTILVGSSCTTARINFNAAFTHAPGCTVQLYNSDPNSRAAYLSGFDASGFNFTLTSSISGGALMFHCDGD